MNDERAGPSSHDLAQPEASGLADQLLREEFAPAPADSARSAGVDQGFVDGRGVPSPDQPRRSRSHRAGTLAGLGVVGVLLAVLVVVAPGGSAPERSPTTPTTRTTTTTTKTTLTNRTTTTTTLHCFGGPVC